MPLTHTTKLVTSPACPHCSSSSCVMQRNEAIKLKEEYHSFRDRGGVYLFILAAALLFGLRRGDLVQGRGEAYTFTPPFMVGVQLFLCWLLYCYTALALRENVLKVGGWAAHAFVC